MQEIIKTINNKVDSWKWKKIEYRSDSDFEGRFGHVCLPYKNGLVLYGGEKHYNKVLRVRECFNDVRYFNLETNELKFIKTWGDFVEGRRNHTGVIISKIMLIYGGINNNGKLLNDVTYLNLETQKWNLCEVEPSILNEEGLSFHSMCAVFKADIKASSPYNTPEYMESFKKGILISSQRNVKEEGLYVFGGKNKNNEANNKLKVLKLWKKPLAWIEPHTEGVAPCARYQHSMNYQEESNFLIIYGGRNDKIGNLGDMFVLRLSNLNWYHVSVNGDFKGNKRFGHCSTTVLDKFIVFGGVNNEGFSKGSLLVFELSIIFFIFYMHINYII